MAFSIKQRIKTLSLKNSLSNIILSAKEFFSNPYLYSFTKHGIDHSERMIHSIEGFLEMCDKRSLLNELECYLLLSSIYLHDIGIELSKIEVIKDFAIENDLIIDDDTDIPGFVRQYHPFLSSYLIKKDIEEEKRPLVYSGTKTLGRFIRLIVEAHGKDFLNNVDYKTYYYHNTEIRVDLLSILLCLADSFDCDDRRIDVTKFKYVELPEVSRVHWMKHYYVSSINFSKRVITISYVFPELSQNEKTTYESFFINATEYWICHIKNRYCEMLKKWDLIFETDRRIEFSAIKRKLEKKDYGYIEDVIFNQALKQDKPFAFKTVSIGIVIKDGSILMVQRTQKEVSKLTNNECSVLEWQFPAGLIRTVDTPEEAIIREVLEETGINCTIKERIGGRIHPTSLTMCYYFALNYKSGVINNGDTYENKSVEWVPISSYKNRITSDIYWKVEDYIVEEGKKWQKNEVVLGVIIRNTKVLLVKRKAGEGLLRWQFPGGIVENNETDEHALLREIHEETGCVVEIEKYMGNRLHPYTKKQVGYYICRYNSGNLKTLDDDLEDIQWVEKSEISDYFTTSIFEPIEKYLL